MSIAQLIAYSIHNLQTLYPANEARALSYNLLQHFSGLSHTQLHAFPDTELSQETTAQIHAAVNDLLRCKPLQYITGEAEFCGLTFAVNEAVLIPRPETEELVHWAIAELNHINAPHPLQALDLCTGSGCMAVSVATLAHAVSVAACDVSENALAVARNNAKRHNVAVNFFTCDILHTPEKLSSSLLPASYHAILSNPPYVRHAEKALMQPNVLNYEPSLALFVDDADPLVFYRAIASIARQYLAPAGFVMVEINEALAGVTAAVFQTAGFLTVQVKQDLHGKDRFLKISNI
jgi:release factor glutamine methyltransferase